MTGDADPPLLFLVGEGRVHMRDGGYYVIAASEHERVEAEWMAGRAFVRTIDPYGDPLTVKLAEASGVMLRTANGARLVYEDQRADAAMRRRDERHDEMLSPGD